MSALKTYTDARYSQLSYTDSRYRGYTDAGYRGYTDSQVTLYRYSG